MGPRRTDLESGAIVVSERMAGATSVSFGLYFPTGSRYETQSNNGISHFIEHLVFKGTDRRAAAEINREIDLLGGASNAYTSKETICFHTRVLPVHLARAVELFGDLATRALPPGLEAEVEREREVILAEIASIEDSPEDLVGDLCDRAYFGDHSLALPVAGSARAVARLALPELRDHFERHMVACDMVVAAAGDVDHEALVELARRNLAGIPQGDRLPALEPPALQRASRLQARELEQVHLCLSARGVARSDPRCRTADLLSLVVGEGYSSRLFREVRDRRGLAYVVYTSLTSYLDSGSFNLYLAVGPQKLERALEVVGEVLADVRGGGIQSDEVDTAKQHLHTSTVLGHESTGARMAHLAECVLLGAADLSVAADLRAIARVDLDGVNALAGELLAEPLALAAVGPLRAERFPAQGWEIPR